MRECLHVRGNQDDFLKMLHLLFRARLKAEEKTKRLKDDFNIVLDNDMRKELNIMCNLSEGIAEEAREEAVEQTTEQITLSHLRNLIQNMKLTAEQAMDALDVPATERSKYAALIG